MDGFNKFISIYFLFHSKNLNHPMFDTKYSTSSTFLSSPKNSYFPHKKQSNMFSTTSQAFYSATNNENSSQYNTYTKITDSSGNKIKEDTKVDAFKKYSQFMSFQNNMITQILFERKNKQNDQQVINKIRQCTNDFIKDILEQLTETISKLRAVKQNTDEKIRCLEKDLKKQKELNIQLKQQFRVEMDQCELKYDNFVRFMENQLRKTIQGYEIKLLDISQQLETKQENYDILLTQKLEISNQLMQTNKLLRQEKEESTDKRKQFKGMENLVEEYQKQMILYEDKLKNKDKQIKNLNEELAKLQQSNKNIESEINRVSELSSQVELLSKLNKEHASLLEKTKKQYNERAKQTLSALTEKQQIINQLTSELQIKQNTLHDLQQELKSKQQITNQTKNAIKKQRAQLREKNQKAKKMYKNKQNLLRQSVKAKLRELKAQNEKLKSYLQRQIFSFYQELRMDLILNNTSQSNFITLLNKREEY